MLLSANTTEATLPDIEFLQCWCIPIPAAGVLTAQRTKLLKRWWVPCYLDGFSPGINARIAETVVCVSVPSAGTLAIRRSELLKRWCVPLPHLVSGSLPSRAISPGRVTGCTIFCCIEVGEGESMEERKPPPARLPGLAAVLTPLRSLLPPGASSGRSATPTSCNVAAEPPRRRPLLIHPDRPHTSPPDCAPQSRCSHGSSPRSSSGDLAPLGLSLPAVLIPRTMLAPDLRPRSPARATAAVRWHRAAVPHIQ